MYVCLSCFLVSVLVCIVFFFKQKTAYEMRISDWSSDVCSSDLTCATWPRCRTRGSSSAPCRRSSAAWGRSRCVRWRGCTKCPERARPVHAAVEIGRASCRERVGQYVEISVVAGSVKKKIQTDNTSILFRIKQNSIISRQK